jgi:surfactin synthase thioesterase subunit
MDSARWLRRFRPAPDAPRRLVCFPHAGGSASFYHPVALAHAPGSDVVVLQYPGRQDRRLEPAVTSVDAYADLIAEILAGEPGKPTVYFGHSMGAAIAFEVAYRLNGTAAAPRAFVASGRRAPGTERDERIHERDDEGVLAELKRLDGTESALLDDDEIVRMALPAIRNDYRAIETYPSRPGLTVDCPITVLLGDGDPKATLAEARRWQEHTTGAFRLRTFPGGHFYLTANAAEVNREIAAELSKLA